MATGSSGPDGGVFVDEKEDEEKPWDTFFRTDPEVNPGDIPEGYKPLLDGRPLEAGLIAASAELVSDLLWGNLALPIDKCLEKLRRIDDVCLRGAPADMELLSHLTKRIEKSVTDAPADTSSPLTEEQRTEELLLRRECREMLELSTQQLEEMSEKKGEFGNEYRVVAAAWYMMMLPKTTLRSPLVAPDDASKAAWEFQEREYERRRVEGTKWRLAREDETLFDEELARRHPYELTQTRRRHEISITIPVPAKTRACDVRVKIQEQHLRIAITTHPLHLVIDDDLYKPIHVSGSGGEWHVEGEFETRRVVVDLDKKKLGNWPCLLLKHAPDEPVVPRKVLSGANGDVDVYAEDETVLQRPTRADKYFSWGEQPEPSQAGAKSVRGMLPSKGGGLPPTAEAAAAQRREQEATAAVTQAVGVVAVE